MPPIALLAQIIKLPNNDVSVNFSLRRNGVPTYSVAHKDKAVVKPSHLDLELMRDGHTSRGLQETDLMNGFTVKAMQTSTFNETWRPIWGEVVTIRNHYNELVVTLHQTSSERNIIVRFRTYNEGMGLHYGLPQQDSLTYFLIKEEYTQLAMAGDHTVWWIPGGYDAQEQKTQQSKLFEIRGRFHGAMDWENSSVAVFLPTDVQTSLQTKNQDGLYISIHEAACMDYSTTHLSLDGKTMMFESWFTLDAYGVKGCMQTLCKSPWRTVVVSDNACDMLSSNLVLSPNESCGIEDTSWIHPIKYCGVWWEMIVGKSTWNYTDEFPSIRLDQIDWSEAKSNGRHVANTDEAKRYIDLAAKNGLDQVLIERWNVGWEGRANHWKQDVSDFVTPCPDFNLKGLDECAHSKGVRLLMRREASSDAMNYEWHSRKAFDLVNQYGYGAVKTGYVGDIIPRGDHHLSQSMNNYYMYVVKQATKHHIMVSVHEATCPTGLCRTQPDTIGNESARGGGYKALGENNPGHTTILPLARLQGGPVDYTPGIFVMKLLEWSNNTSLVHPTLAGQLALYVTMCNPLQMAADLLEYCEKYDDAFQFIRGVTVDWGDSKYSEAEPGDYITVTRRVKGTDSWFIGGKYNENGHKGVTKLDFLDKDKKYRYTIYAGTKSVHYDHNPQAYAVMHRTVKRGNVLKINQANGGRFVASLMTQ